MSLSKQKTHNQSENNNLTDFKQKSYKNKNSNTNVNKIKNIIPNKINFQQQHKNDVKRSSVSKLLYEIQLNYYTYTNSNNTINQNSNQIENVPTLKKISKNHDANSNNLSKSIDNSLSSKTIYKSKNINKQKSLFFIDSINNENRDHSPQIPMHQSSKIPELLIDEAKNYIKDRRQSKYNRSQLTSSFSKKNISFEKSNSQSKYRTKPRDSIKNKKTTPFFPSLSYINNIKKIHMKAKKPKFFYNNYIVKNSKNNLALSERSRNEYKSESKFSNKNIYNIEIMNRINKIQTHSVNKSITKDEYSKISKNLTICSSFKKVKQVSKDKDFNKKRKTVASVHIKDNVNFLNMNNDFSYTKKKNDYTVLCNPKNNLNKNSNDLNNIIQEKIGKMKKSNVNSKRHLDFNNLIINNSKYSNKKALFNDIPVQIEYHQDKIVTSENISDININYKKGNTKVNKHQNKTIMEYDDNFSRTKTSENNRSTNKNKNNLSIDSIKKNKQNNNYVSSNYDFNKNFKTKNINIKHNRRQSLVLDSIFIKNTSKKNVKPVNKKSQSKFSPRKKIKDNIIYNSLFENNNMNELPDDIDDKFDDLYSIVKKINFNNVLSTNEGLFNNGNKKYQNYKQKYDNKYDNYFCKKNKKLHK